MRNRRRIPSARDPNSEERHGVALQAGRYSSSVEISRSEALHPLLSIKLALRPLTCELRRQLIHKLILRISVGFRIHF